MKATQLLRQQHREVEAIFQAIKTGNGDPMVLIEKLADALVAHMAIEQKLFYPAAQSIDEDLVLESYEEHAVAEFCLKRLLACDPSDPTLKAKTMVLEEMLENHITEEENELFPRVERELGAQTLERLGAKMEKMFAEATEEGHEATLGTRKPPTTSVDEDINILSPNLSGRPSVPSIA